MFYHLEGTVTELSHDTLVLDCSGVGFEVTITPNTASSMKRGDKGKVYITESIGENNFDLYGFLTWREKQFFKMLTSVSGVGPKAAMSILSYNTPDSLAISIVNENESLDSALRRFKKNCARNGTLAEIRKREHYEKPSVRRKKKSEAARKRKFKK